jgi:hypothetical protein
MATAISTWWWATFVIWRGIDGAQNRLYQNDGTGRFTDVTVSFLPIESDATQALALGDVDGDGDVDLVVGNIGQNRLHLNDGSGWFTDATAARLPVDDDETVALALVDVDGDSDRDLIVVNEGYEQHIKLYLNDGAGAFTDATAGRMPAFCGASVAAGDVDRDGDTDVVVGRLNQQNLLLLNDGAGVFADATATRLPPDADWTNAVALVDVDGDGDPDLVLANSNTSNRLLLNDGTGTFSAAPAGRLPTDRDVTFAVAAADVDGDGDADLVLGNGALGENRLYFNDGAGGFVDATQPRLPAVGASVNAAALADVDGDGDLDLALGHSTAAVRLLRNDGTGTFMEAPMPPDVGDTRSLAFADVDRDGDADLLVGNRLQNRLLLNDGNGKFTDATAARLPVDKDIALSLAVGDVDGDGDLDIVVGTGQGQRDHLYLNDGSGTFYDADPRRLPDNEDATHGLAFADVDGDGDLDLLLANAMQNRLYRNDDKGMFADVTSTHLPPESDWPTSIAAGDLDGDGDVDFVVGIVDRHENAVYRNDGTGVFSRTLLGGSDCTEALALGDVDADGDLDVLFANSRDFDRAGGANQLWLNQGDGTFVDARARLPRERAEERRGDGDNTHAVVLGDLDGDGDLDIVWGNRNTPSRLHCNLLRQLEAPRLAIPGRAYELAAYARFGPPRAADVVIPLVSGGRASIPLPPLGTFGLDPTCLIPLPPFEIPATTGVASRMFGLPDLPDLLGKAIHGQALLIQLGARSWLTNVTGDRFGR